MKGFTNVSIKLRLMLFLENVALVTFALCTLVNFVVFNSARLTHKLHNITLTILSLLVFIVCRNKILKILKYLIRSQE